MHTHLLPWMNRPLRPSFALLFLSLSLFCIQSAYSQIEWNSFEVELTEEEKERVQYGHINVPENRENPNSRTIRMAFAVLKKTEDNDNNDAVLLLPGGPGQGFTDRIRLGLNRDIFKRILEKRDIVFIDPRGCLNSGPSLCDMLNDPDYINQVALLSAEKRLEIEQEAARACAEALKREKVDVHAYNSIEVASDLEDLRKALGYDQWNLRGQSYGSYYGFVLLQKYPESIRSAVFSGIVNMEPIKNGNTFSYLNALNKTFESCRQDPECNQKFPQLEENLYAVLKRLETDPLEIVLKSKTDGSEQTFLIGPETLSAGIFNLLYGKEGIELVPALIETLKEGNDWIIQNLAEQLIDTFGFGLDQDMLLVIRNNDLEYDKPRMKSLDEAPLQSLVKNDWYSKNTAQRQWSILRQKDSFPQAVYDTLNIPTIFVSGYLDPITPPYNTPSMEKYLPNSQHAVVQTSGHFSTYETNMRYEEFIENPDPQMDLESLMEVKPLNFITAYSLNPGISALASDLSKGIMTKGYVFGVFLVFALIGALYFPLRFLVIRLKKSAVEFNRAHWSVWLLALFTLLAGVGLVMAFYSTLNENPYLLALGLSSKWDGLYVIYGLQAFSLLIILFRFKRVWTSSKFAVALSCIGGIGFLAAMAVYGFI